jgi:hypothetical protein
MCINISKTFLVEIDICKTIPGHPCRVSRGSGQQWGWKCLKIFIFNIYLLYTYIFNIYIYLYVHFLSVRWTAMMLVLKNWLDLCLSWQSVGTYIGTEVEYYGSMSKRMNAQSLLTHLQKSMTQLRMYAFSAQSQFSTTSLISFPGVKLVPLKGWTLAPRGDIGS